MVGWPHDLAIGVGRGDADALARQGDLIGLHAYAQWLPRSRVTEAFSIPALFVPLWAYPTDPAIAAASEWAFNDPHSPYNPLQPLMNGHREIDAAVSSRLLVLPAFRDQVQRELADQHVWETEPGTSQSIRN